MENELPAEDVSIEGEEDGQPPEELELSEDYWSALLNDSDVEPPEPVPTSGYNGWKDQSYDHPPTLHQDYSSDHMSDDDWVLAQKTHENDKAVELTVTGYNRGGLLVTWNSLRGFVPASQLIDFPVDVSDITRRELLSKYIGRSLNLRIIELDVDANRLILSERAAEVEPGQRASVLQELASGTTCKGMVTNLCDFGAFIDLGGVEGLIHISELSWGRVGHPRDVLSSGEDVTVYIMDVDPDQERVALSLKRLQPDPWESVENKYEIGQTVEGVITNVVDFGAFACIEDGLEGLIHISELAEGQFLHPRNVVQEGEKITARILNIDGSARRLGLSLRQDIDENDDASGNLNKFLSWR